MKKWLTLVILSSTILLGSCGDKPTDEELARQAIYEENMSNAPELSEKEQAMIKESRGVVIGEEKTEDEETIEVLNSFSPGEEVVGKLASMTKEELLELDALSHLEIFINGVIRDEYTVAAHTLYGAEDVAMYKKAFRDGLLSEVPKPKDEKEISLETTYIDRIGLNSAINDPNVARNHVDVVIEQLNRIFVEVEQDSNFGNRVTVLGKVYPVELSNQLQAMNNAAFEFVGIEADKYRSRMSDDQLAGLNRYFIETFPNALLEAPISQSSYYSDELGGFERNEDGTWAPAQMGQFSWNLIRLVYGIR